MDDGDKRKEAGMSRVLGNTDPVWIAGYRSAFDKWAAEKQGETVASEHFHLYVAPIIGQPPSPNSWGAMWSGMAKRGKIKKRNGHHKSVRKSRQSNTTPMWEIV
jgi:hypothetical protein